MTIAEKWYRERHKISFADKLTNEQWKVVNMLHECLKMNNKPKLPHGAIVVEKKQLVEHLANVKMCLKKTDELMLNPLYKEFSTGKGGSELARIWNVLNMTWQSINHFQLKIPLEKLNATN